MISIIKIKMGVVFVPKVESKIEKKKKWKEDGFLGNIGIFYEVNKVKIKGKSFSHILDNIVIFQVKKVTFQRHFGKNLGS